MGKVPRGLVLVTGSTAILAWSAAAPAAHCPGFCARNDPETGTIFRYTYEAIRTVALGLSGPVAVITLIATWRNVNASRKQQRASALFDLDARWESDLLKRPKQDAYVLIIEQIKISEHAFFLARKPLRTKRRHGSTTNSGPSRNTTARNIKALWTSSAF